MKTQKISSTTFLVDDVVPADRPIWTEDLYVSVDKRFKRKVILIPEPETPVTNASYDGLLSLKGVWEKPFSPENVVSRCHPLIDAVGLAFSQHRPLTLSPDAIWLVIAQGFSHHVAENADSLRPRLVRHVGTREISTSIGELSLAGFEAAISDVSSQIREASDPILHENLICEFSTTTPAIRTASQVALMDCIGATSPTLSTASVAYPALHSPDL